MARKSKTYYLFDLKGKLIGDFDGLNDMSEFTNIPKESLKAASRISGVLHSMYYVSDDISFDIDSLTKKVQHNPWLKKPKP